MMRMLDKTIITVGLTTVTIGQSFNRLIYHISLFCPLTHQTIIIRFTLKTFPDTNTQNKLCFETLSLTKKYKL